MPNVWTHILFGNKVIERAELHNMVEDVRTYFQLGTQGPDPFFYHNYWPWKSKPVTLIGERIHYEQCGPFLMKMIQHGYENKSDSKLLAYILGFVTHHLLDRNTHPYIIYRSGNEENRHQKLEIIIDTILMKRWKNIDTYKVPVYKEIYIGPTLYNPIRSMLSKLIQDTFPKEADTMPADYVNKSYQYMIHALKVLHDPLGWKNRILKKRISPFSYQKNVEDKDYLNEQKTEWLHPTNEDEASVDCFLTLFQNAEKEGVDILTLIWNYWHTGEPECLKTISEKLGNLSYDTGKDCTLMLENRYFKPIL
ncbi:zinc dependent phospholipase C family protein [Bacillus salitolerans]|uniref:Zinc dependent phospholipase C family protein n=1 Tax=Bacillus salitolerans TaxID=1437434 RepID=A0ABW4LIM7_9BACI